MEVSRLLSHVSLLCVQIQTTLPQKRCNKAWLGVKEATKIRRQFSGRNGQIVASFVNSADSTDCSVGR